MLERRREPRKAPPSETIQRPPRSADWGLWWQPRVLRPGLGLRRNNKLKTRFAGSQAVRVAGSRPQGPVGQVSRGLGAGLGARPAGAWGPFPQTFQITFFRKFLVGAWRRRGCRLKRLLRRWGPGGKRSRDTPPPPHPPAVREKGRGFSPSPPSATIQHAPQGRRIRNQKPRVSQIPNFFMNLSPELSNSQSPPPTPCKS